MSSTPYPLSVAESQGAMIETTFLLVSGFKDEFNATTSHAYTLDTTNASAVWMRQDDYPMLGGITHAAFVVVRGQFFICGGYRGGAPGPHTNRCFVMDLSQPKGRQWSPLAALPNGGRAAGGLVYDSALDSLIFSGGSQRPILHNITTVDYTNTWMYSFRNPRGKWIPKAPIPYTANHISYVTTTDAAGRERHYFSGGQDRENEAFGNKRDHYEYVASTDTWTRRMPIPFARGHTSSSTRAVGCGYFVAGGATNGKVKLSDISYYHVPTDRWTVSIGQLPKALNTPVCDISGEYWYCESGLVYGKFSYKIRITI
jgi:N-acetylneuraminic acid mutarotase